MTNLLPLTKTRRASTPWWEVDDWDDDVPYEDMWDLYPDISFGDDEVANGPEDTWDTRRQSCITEADRMSPCAHWNINSTTLVCSACQEDDAWWAHFDRYTWEPARDEEYEDDSLHSSFDSSEDRLSAVNLRRILGNPIGANQAKAVRQRRRNNTARHHARRLRTADIVQNQSPDALACFAGFSNSGKPIEAKPWFAHSRALVAYHDYSDEERKRRARVQLIFELQTAADDMGW